VNAADGSGNGNTGTLTSGPTWATGQIGGAVQFDGADDYVNMGDISVAENIPQLTVSAWVKPGAAMTDNRGIVAKRSTAGAASWSLTLDTSGQKLYFRVETNNGQFNVFSGSTSITDTSRWYHVVAVYTGVQALYYVDGVQDVTPVAATGTIIDTANSVWIGGHFSSSYLWNGLIDDVRIYSRALSVGEVTRLYQMTSPGSADTSLIGHWTFDGPTLHGTTVDDLSRGGNAGTLTNGPAVTEGKFGQALSFDGTDDTVTVGDLNILDGASALSVSTWVRASSPLQELDTAIGKYSNVADQFQLQTGNSSWCGTSANIQVMLGFGVLGCTGAVHGADEWEHWTMVFDGAQTGDGNRLKFYLNGVQQTLSFTGGAIPATLYSNSAPLRIGARDTNGNPSNTWSGSIDDVRIYNRALTAAEVGWLSRQGTATLTR
jgi:hypothetical protein